MPPSCPTAQRSPEPSLSMLFLLPHPLHLLAVIHPHPSRLSIHLLYPLRTSPGCRRVLPTFRTSLSRRLAIQEGVGGVRLWDTVHSLPVHAVSVSVPIRLWRGAAIRGSTVGSRVCGCGCIRVRRGSEALAFPLRTGNLLLACSPAGRNQGLYTGIYDTRGSAGLLRSASTAGFHMRRSRCKDEGRRGLRAFLQGLARRAPVPLVARTVFAMLTVRSLRRIRVCLRIQEEEPRP